MAKAKAVPKKSLASDSDSAGDEPSTPPPPPPKRGRGRPPKSRGADTTDDVHATPRKKSTSPTKCVLKSAEVIDDSDDCDDPPPTPSPQKKGASKAKGAPITAKDAVTYSSTKLPIRKHPLDKTTKALSSDSDSVKSGNDESGKEENGDDCEFEGDDKSIVSLDKDDDLFPEPVAPSKVKIASQPAPATPPLKTRASAKDKRALSSTPEGPVSPTKKAKKESGSASLQEVPAKNKKIFPVVEIPARSKAVAKAAKQVSSDDSDFFVHSVPVKKEVAKVAKQVSSDDSDFFVNSVPVKKEVEEGSESDDSFTIPAPVSKPVLQELEMIHAVGPAPKVCEVQNPKDQDEALLANGFYENLPLLRYVLFKPVKTSQGGGLVWFHEWQMKLKKSFHQTAAARTIKFIQDGRFINLSCINPYDTQYGVRHPNPKSINIWEVCVGTQTAVCMTPVFVTESFTLSFKEKMDYHFISGIWHSEEFAHVIAVLGAISQNDHLKANVWGDALRFATKLNGGNRPTPVAIASLPDMPGMFNASSSPSKSTGKDTSIPFSRRKVQPPECGQSIPVYDVRGASIKMDAQTFDDIATKYPHIKGEIPVGSFALIAYVAQLHKKDDGYQFYAYPLLALLYGVPKEDVYKKVSSTMS